MPAAALAYVIVSVSARPSRSQRTPVVRRPARLTRLTAPRSVTGQALEGTQRQDDQHEQRGPDQKRLAPAERGHERLPQRDEAERAEARPEIGDGDRAPARSGVPERGEDQVRLAAERGEGEAAEHTVGQHEERQRVDPARERKGEHPEHGAPLEEAAGPQPVERPADERAADAAEEQRRRLHRRDLAARPAELGDERQVEDGERHEDAVLDGERHGRDREGASRVALGRPGVRHPARSTRRCASAASIDCRRWGGSIGFVTWSKAPNARLRLASSMFTLSFSMITFAAGTSATIAGSTPTPLSPGISTSSSTRWGALSTTARTPLAASLMRRTS